MSKRKIKGVLKILDEVQENVLYSNIIATPKRLKDLTAAEKEKLYFLDPKTASQYFSNCEVMEGKKEKIVLPKKPTKDGESKEAKE